MERILNTWKRRGIRPVFHMSDQAPGARRGKHADMVKELPPELLQIPKKFGIELDIEVEARNKEQAVLSLYEKYTTKTVVDGRVVEMEKMITVHGHS
jgi:UV DNA damage endonuclease